MIFFRINPAKLQNPIRKMEAFLARDSAIKDTAQRAVSHYAKAVFFMKHKEIFNVQAMDFEAFSKSLGLAVPPRIRFLDRMNKKQQFAGGNISRTEEKQELVREENKRNNKKMYFDNNESDGEQDSENDDVKEEIEEIR